MGSDGVTESDLWLGNQQLNSDVLLRQNVMKGFFSLSPTVPAGPAFDSYAARLSSRPSTAPFNSSCNLETDDEGTPIWLFDSTGSVCTGTTGEDAVKSVYSAFAYDATYALAHALHDLIEVQKKVNLSGHVIYDSLIHRVRFDGVTGKVAFSAAAEDEGDRLNSIGYTVRNYKNSSAESAVIGFWRPCDGSVNCSFSSRWDEISAPVFSTSDNAIPVDSSYAQTDIVLVVGSIGVSHEYTYDSFRWLLGTTLFAADLARRTINADHTLLPGRNISFFLAETQCSSTQSFTSVEAAARDLQRGLATGTRMVGFLGAQCSSACRTVATYGALAKIPQVSHGCTSTTLDDPVRYPYFNRVIGVDSEQAAALSALCAYYNWTRVAVLTDSGEYGRALKETIISSFSATIAVALTIETSSPTLAEDVAPVKTADTPVVVLAIAARLTSVITALEDVGVSGATGYQILGTETTSILIIESGATTGRGGIIYTSPSRGNQSRFNAQLVSQYSEWYREMYPDRTREPPPSGPYLGSVSAYSAYMYDAVMLFAHSLHSVLADGGSVHDPDAVMAKLRSVSIDGLTGRFGLDAHGQRAGEWAFVYLAPSQGIYNYTAVPFGTHALKTGELLLSSSPTFGNGLTFPPLAFFPPETPNAPQIRVLQTATVASVYVSWQLPPLRFAPLLAFAVELRPPGGVWREVFRSSSAVNTSAYLPGDFSSGGLFSVRSFVATLGGRSNYSDVSTFTTQLVLSCPPGYGASMVAGILQCAECAEGTYSDTTDDSRCTPCASGYFQLRRGSSRCEACVNGTYQPELGGMCVACPHPTSSTLAATSCDVCAAGHFLPAGMRASSSSCRPCPSGGICGWNATVETIAVQPNFWRLSLQTDMLSPCGPRWRDPSLVTTCAGGSAGDQICAAGSAGPGCEICLHEKQYYEAGTCRDCPQTGASVGIVVGLFMAVLGVCGVFYYLHEQRSPRFDPIVVPLRRVVYYCKEWSRTVGLIPKLKMAIAFTQVRGLDRWGVEAIALI